MPLTAPPDAPDAPPTTPNRQVTATFDEDADTAWAYLFAAFWTFISGLRAWYNDYAKPELEALQTDVAAKQALAATAAGNAGTYATAAAASAATALAAPGTAATSVTNDTIGEGATSITIQAGKDIVVGMTVVAASTASPTNWQAGPVTAYNSGTGVLDFTVQRTSGAGTFAAWTVSVSAAVGDIAYAELVGRPVETILAMTGALALSDLTTYNTSPKVEAPSNAAAVPASLTTSDGWSVATGFVAGTGKSIAPVSIATAHGAWGSLVMTPATIATIVGAGTNAILGTVLLDADYVAVLYRDNTDAKVVVINTATGAIGAAATISAYNNATGAGIFKDSATSFVAFVNHAASNASVRAGSVNTGTLAITLGAVQLTGTALYRTPLKLNSGLYAFVQDNASSLRAAVITATTTVTLGAAAAVGAYSESNANTVHISRAGNTTFLAVYLANGGGSSTTRNLVARVVTVNAGTGALTLEAAAASATNDKNNTGLRVLAAYTEGASYIAAAQNGTVTTTGDFYGITVAGTVTTISAATQRALDLPAVHAPGTWNYVLGGSAVMRYDATTMLFGHLAGGAYAVTIAGTVLTFGATFALSGASTILVDAATGANFYAVAATTFDKISVAAGVITSAWQVSAAPTLVVSDTLTDKAVSYAGTWYTWSLSPVAAVTSTRWLFDSGNNFIYGGPVT